MEEGGGAGLTPHDIYLQVTGRAGTDALNAASRAARAEAELEARRAEEVRQLADKIQAGWQGAAADNAHGAAGPLADATREGADSLLTVDRLLAEHSDAFNHTVLTVRPVPATPPQSNILNDMTPWETDLDREIKQYQDDAQHNIAVYGGYDEASWSNGQQLPREYTTISDSGGDISVTQPGATPAGPPPGGPPPGGPSPGGPPTGGPQPGAGGDQPAPASSGGGGPGAGAGPDAAGGPRPQGTDPSLATPPAGTRPPIVGPQPPGIQPPGNQPPHDGLPPVGGWPVGGRPPGFGPDGGRGGAGPGGQPGRGGAGGVNDGPGGRGPGAGGPGARGGVGGEPGTGGRPGAGLGAGGLAAEEAARRGGAASPGARGTAGGGGFGSMGAGRGQGGEDEEHDRKYTIEPDPEELFGTDQLTAPPVIGE